MKSRKLIVLAWATLLIMASLLSVPVLAASAAGQDASQDTRAVATQQTDKIAWLSFQDGKAAAAETERPMLVNFTASWCTYCKKMKRETYADSEVIAYVNENYIPVRVDTQKEQKLAAKYYVRSIPIIWFLGSDGERITSLPGYVDPKNFLLVLEFIASESYNSMDFETFINTRSDES